MKFLLDANVELRLARLLTSEGHDVKTIALDYTANLKDYDVLSLAVQQKRILITNDSDFGELVVRQQRRHHGVILFRLKNSRDISLKFRLLKALLSKHKAEIHEFFIITSKSVRMRKTRISEAA
jgi:predicted nuclease of predicted toxin-antitoxin system